MGSRPAAARATIRPVIRNRHELAEERSLALHAAVARRLAEDPALLEKARSRVERWLADGSVHPDYARAWREILSRPLAEITGLLADRGERARGLRQVTPFAGVVPPRDRWRIWREVEDRLSQSS